MEGWSVGEEGADGRFALSEHGSSSGTCTVLIPADGSSGEELWECRGARDDGQRAQADYTAALLEALQWRGDPPDGVRTLTVERTHSNERAGSSGIVEHENAELQPQMGQTSSSALYDDLQSRQD
jgi:hypothetical protein